MAIVQVTVAQFRSNFIEFANVQRFPNGFVQFWLDWAYRMVGPAQRRWGNMFDSAAQLFAAHNLSIERRAMDEAIISSRAQAGTVGSTLGPMSSKSVDKVSASYDTASSIDPDAGHWNLTIYGNRLWSMIKMFGAGPIQLGTAPCGGFICFIAGVPVWWSGWFD